MYIYLFDGLHADEKYIYIYLLYIICIFTYLMVCMLMRNVYIPIWWSACWWEMYIYLFHGLHADVKCIFTYLIVCMLIRNVYIPIWWSAICMLMRNVYLPIWWSACWWEMYIYLFNGLHADEKCIFTYLMVCMLMRNIYTYLMVCMLMRNVDCFKIHQNTIRLCSPM